MSEDAWSQLDDGQFVNSSAKSPSLWDSSLSQPSLWFLSSLSFVARANDLLNGHWMDEHLAEKSHHTTDAAAVPTLRTGALVASKTLLELDLDYLERRGDGFGEAEAAATASSAANKEEDSPADTLERVKVIFLGAPGVGKTSIIRQFVWSEFSEEYRPTERRETYYPSVVLAERLYELKISDLPTIPYFPVSSHLEWTDFRYYGLRSATAYVLVFDLSNQETFQYIRTLREQIYEARDMRNVPVLVVGNKQDKLPPSGTGASGGSGSSGGGLPGTRHRDIVNLVRKHWRCGYVECSARFNCRVVQVFRELMKSIAVLEGKTASSPTSSLPLLRSQEVTSSGSSSGNDPASAGASGSDKCTLL
ncbi:ras-related protein Ral-B [Phymastichus coffea]|uniref:ras-related protein Ral-B n=1 Tax=Phymastichus coffea TaxID=108790 RepID=UPI00273C88AD|nr:ras-related protein Ral-B [Phymastichus coffea]